MAAGSDLLLGIQRFPREPLLLLPELLGTPRFGGPRAAGWEAKVCGETPKIDKRPR